MLSLLRESLVIAGWVAMWRPMEIYLYEWWPLRRRRRVYQKLSRIPLEVVLASPHSSNKSFLGVIEIMRKFRARWSRALVTRPSRSGSGR
jgi:hypothetical protein